MAKQNTSESMKIFVRCLLQIAMVGFFSVATSKHFASDVILCFFVDTPVAYRQ